MLNIIVDRTTALSLRSSFSLRWATDSNHYLGVDIKPDPSTLYSANFVPLLPWLKTDFLHWRSLTLTWFRQCNTLKMTMLPKVLYLLQALLIHLPLQFFQRVSSMFREFVWSHRRPRLKLKLLHLHPQGGGLPDVMAYYRAVHLTRIVDWYCHGEAKQWVAMELEDSNDTVKSWPWITCSLPKALSDHSTLGSTLSVDRDAFRHSSISPLPSLLVRILGSPEFILGLQNPHF